MKWVLIIGGVIVALVLIVVVVGALLPRDHVATMTAWIAASPDTIWKTITDPAAFPNWRRDVTRVEILPPTANGPSWREHSRNGTLTMVVDAADPPRRLVARIADDNLPYGGQWEYTITSDGASGSNVTITERGSVYNPLFRFVSRYVMGHTATIDAYLRALGKHFGTEPTPSIIEVAGESRGL